MRKSQVCPVHKQNDRRGIAKLKRNKGLLAMKKAGKTPAEWAQRTDPLFKIKGIKRHRLLHMKGE
jgi:hypothetical protein